MKSTAASLLPLFFSAALVSAHGYVDNATIGGTFYEFYQPYTDPYTSPTPSRISRAIQGNGPVQDVTLQDIQCGGYTAGGINGSSPAALHAPAEAGSNVTLHWTLWPSSHFGALVTYMARCPDTGCRSICRTTTRCGSRSPRRTDRQGDGRVGGDVADGGRKRRVHLHHPGVSCQWLLLGAARDHRGVCGEHVSRRAAVPRVSPAERHGLRLDGGLGSGQLSGCVHRV
jgi:hypothetical protein